MAKHIQHIHTNEPGRVFAPDELLIGEIGINTATGRLSIYDDDEHVCEFINKEDTQELVSEKIKTEISTEVAPLREEIETLKTNTGNSDLSFSTQITNLETEIDDINAKLEKSNVEGLNHILCRQEEPEEKYRKDYLWLQETEEVVDVDDFQTDIRAMQRAIIELTKLVQKHEYVFSNTMNCGTVTENNTRTTLMRSATPEPPEGFFDGTKPKPIAILSDNKKIKKLTDYYLATDLVYGVEHKTDGWVDYVDTIDDVKKYLWNYATIVFDNDVMETTQPEMVAVYNDIRAFDTVVNYYALGNSGEEAPKQDSDDYSEELPEFNENKPYLWRYVKALYLENDEENKPDYNEYGSANVKHLVIKSAKTEQEIRDNLVNVLNNELVWCEANNGLYIKSKNRLVKINGATSIAPGDDNNDNNTDIEDIMTGITFINDGVGAIDFISSKGNKYTMKVNDEGKLCVYDNALNTPHPAPTGDATGKEGDNVSGLFLQKLYINSVYCGGIVDANGNEIDEHSLNPCSHNFVELSNLTNADINLNGLSLQYAKNGTDWKVLPLWGVIKAGSTFLIRGAQCSIMNHNTTVIKVKDYDMQWYDTDGKLIKFDNKSAKFYLRYGTTPCDVANPFVYNSSKPAETVMKYGYIDLVGFASDANNNPGGYENSVYQFLNSKRLFKKYYAMDNVSQATKAKDKRNNKNDWYYVDLTRNDILPNIEAYTPRASAYGKNIFYDKTGFKENKPTIATITFGIQATDNGSGATRCFNWVSKGYYDEYVWYRKKGATSWTRIESFKDLTGDIDKYYNRVQQEASNGEVFTTHKLIIRGLTSGTYEYTCGKSLKSGEPNMDACIDVREFIVRTDADVNAGFTFIQVSDQQGFNWDEYQVWKYTADYIAENHNTQFLINTGDMTQNGNRMNEWFDYFNGKTALNNLEEMATIGNNDLCPKVVYKLGDGGDSSKINFANINFFYTFEIDEENPPIFGDGDTFYGYIPSIYSFNYGNTHFMCLNSEISEKTETDVLGIENNKGIIYEKVKQWCENDIAKCSNAQWKIAYCHEMPFTIITDAVMSDFYDPQKNNGMEVADKNYRGGSRINTNTKKVNEYWFSQFCQNNGIRLVMGGHKHTQAITWPIRENVVDGVVNSMKPIIEVTSSDLSTFFEGSTSLIKIVDDSELNGQRFPNKWFMAEYQNNTEANRGNINASYERNCHFCTFELVEKATAPIYSMSQSTGYKHTSNKELPAAQLPWQHYYFPNKNGSVNTEQRYPFYSVYNVTPDTITIDVKRIKNVLIGGKFDINIQGEALKNGQNTVEVDNGLKDSDFSSNNNVVINR